MFPILRDNDIARELIFSKFDEVSLHVFRVHSASDVEGVGLGLISPSSQREYPLLCLEVGFNSSQRQTLKNFAEVGTNSSREWTSERVECLSQNAVVRPGRVGLREEF